MSDAVDIGTERSIGILGAVGIGVGAIVGGGILALAGVAFSVTGPSAILAFALNGVIALITALSFAELSAAFPDSGGTYVFSKKVLSIRAAFAVGWVVWFASIVAAVLYAVGAGYFIGVLFDGLLSGIPGFHHVWPGAYRTALGIALIAIVYFTLSLIFKKGGGRGIANIGKIAAFSILIIARVSGAPKGDNRRYQKGFHPILIIRSAGPDPGDGIYVYNASGVRPHSRRSRRDKKSRKNYPEGDDNFVIALAIYIPLIFVMTDRALLDQSGGIDYCSQPREPGIDNRNNGRNVSGKGRLLNRHRRRYTLDALGPLREYIGGIPRCPEHGPGPDASEGPRKR